MLPTGFTLFTLYARMKSLYPVERHRMGKDETNGTGKQVMFKCEQQERKPTKIIRARWAKDKKQREVRARLIDRCSISG